MTVVAECNYCGQKVPVQWMTIRYGYLVCAGGQCVTVIDIKKETS